MQWPLGGQQRRACVGSGSWSSWPSRGLVRRRGDTCWSHGQQKWPPESVKEIVSQETNTCSQKWKCAQRTLVILKWSRRESLWVMLSEIFTVLSSSQGFTLFSFITYCMQIEEGSLVHFITQWCHAMSTSVWTRRGHWIMNISPSVFALLHVSNHKLDSGKAWK